MMQFEPPKPGTDSERMLFVYWDGTQERIADPLVIGRKLEKACPEYQKHLGTIQAAPPAEMEQLMGGTPVGDDLKRQKDEANEELLAATRAAFGVEPVKRKEGKTIGLSEAETSTLLVSFLAWMSGAMEEARPFSTSQPRDAPSTPPDSPTARSADSGLAAT